MIRASSAAALLALLLYAGFRPLGPLPPLGSLLDPANGAWSSAPYRRRSSETVEIPRLARPVDVIFDDRAVPHIFAEREEDAYRALGYVVARDRLFQMELQTRAASGRLTEWFGRRALAADRRNRALGFTRAAAAKMAAYDTAAPSYRAIAAYADGVNAWIASLRTRDLPVEYRLLGVRPERWQPVNSMYFYLRMSHTLGFNDATLKRLRAQARVGAEAADALFPVNSAIQEPIQPNGLSGPRMDLAQIPPPGLPDSSVMLALVAREATRSALAERSSERFADAIGSNSWAVSPSRTSTGHAMLAGDPHLELSLPSVWYELHLVVPGRLDVAGVGFPGVPGLFIGFNRDVAWTFTNTGADVNDYYIETVDDSVSPRRYRLDGQWRPLESRMEEYRNTNGRTLHTDTLYYTHRGPMTRQLGRWISMRWTALEPSTELDNFIGVLRARDAREWLEKMRDFRAPTQNGLVADKAGNIAIRSTGAYPVRPGDGRGDLLRDGSLSSSDWRGFLTLQSQPFAMNPAQGYLASANQQPVDPRVNPSYMGSNWYSPWRAIRLNALLRGDSAVSPDAMRRFQTDPRSARADAFVPWFTGAAAREDSAGRADPVLRQAAAILGRWDRQYRKDSRQAVLFERAMEELESRTWDELTHDAGADSSATNVALPQAQILLQLLQSPLSPWWDDRRTPAAMETRDAILAASLRAAYVLARERHGPVESDGWSWANVHHANIHHLLRIPGFSRLKLPVQAGPSTLSPSAGSGTHGASWRMVVELGPEVRAWGIYPGGQSGNPASPRYADRMSFWLNGQLAPILFPRSAAEIGRDRVSSVLRLEGR